MFIVIDNYQDLFGRGDTLEAAFKDLEEKNGDSYGSASSNLTFYEANEITVEIKLVKKETKTKRKD